MENHISDVLQLYEFSMAIGKSLDYKESCDFFLRLVLKRKNLNAAWILERNKNKINSTYSVPFGRQISTGLGSDINQILNGIETFKLLNYDELNTELIPIDIHSGTIAVFNLQDQGFLCLFSKNDSISTRHLSQLLPVIEKFSMALKACKAFSNKQILLNNLEIRNQELSDYAHMVSHDLKSPLRSIDTLTTWLKDDYQDKLDDNGKNSIELIRNNVEKMDTLINGILEYSTIGKNQIEIYDVNIDMLIDDILSIIQVPEHITIVKTKMPIIRGDKYRLQQLFQNLIDNAISYNDKAKGYIEIGAEETSGFWKFHVKDNGKGIPNAYFNKIFKTFERLETGNQSTGIGLSIVKKIVELYNGEISVTSDIGIGTTFYFTLKK